MPRAYTRELASYAASLDYPDLPAEVADMSKTVILDTLGVIVAASRYRPGQLMAELVRQLGGHPQASVIGFDFCTSMTNAALANGTMGHDMELDDVQLPGNLHAAAVYVPAALAVAEPEKAQGRRFITAVVAAYDVATRISIALDDAKQYARAFHPTAIGGTFGAAVAAGKVLGLDAEGFVNALGLAGCQAAGLTAWTTELQHYTKSFQTGVPARSGVTAALLASLGYLGPPAILEGDNNIFYAFSGEHHYQKLTEELGSRYEIMRTSLKEYSCCRYIHSPLDAYFSLARPQQLTADQIDHLTVRMAHTCVPIVDNNELLTHNLQYIMAAAIYDGVMTRAQYSLERSRDPKLWEMAQRITLVGDNELQKLYPERWAAIVEVSTKDGRTFRARVDNSKGTPGNPLTLEDVERKFMNLVSPVLGEAKAQQIKEMVNRLETVEDVSQLGDLLRVS